MGGGLGRVTHHSEYYLEDGSVSFLTEGVLFKVHKTFFQRESTVFRELFENAADDPSSGTDACPFTLDVTPSEFAQFLWVWYDRDYGYRQQTKDNWLIILRLAKRWHFDKIGELALREIEFLELPPAERISMYDELGIDGERLISSCVELCKSPRVPTQDEARSMRMETLIKILQAREDAQRKAVELGHESPTSACLEDQVLREIVSKLFKKSLDPRSSGTSTGSGDQVSDLEPAHKTSGNTSTITIGEPQVPDRKTRTANQPPLHPTNAPQTNGDGKESQEKKQGSQVVEGAEGKKLEEAEKDKAEKEAAEEAKRSKEKAEKEAKKLAKAAKDKADKEAAEKAKLEREKEAQQGTGSRRNRHSGI